ncbi:unnamed protein product [Paramecium pentaurelia]|uniref:Carboxypeptidase Q n=1 Tax=Paramecium pentaurelia TaxID=43138 RepID=A0A8S1SVU8_9CILI|nr:unnamed protein product [Paramecium pentaurelia]
MTIAYCTNDAIKKNVDNIRQAINAGPNKHKAYDKLAYIVDTFGPRMWASPRMALAVDYLYNQIQNWEATKNGLVEVRLEKLDEISTWVRGSEQLILKSPRKRPQKLGMIGLGLIVPGNIKDGEVVVVRNWSELDEKGKANKIKGKIVCYNVPWTTYDDLKFYRQQGPDRASAYGAIAVLLRSVASFSIYSPHTGNVRYSGNFTKIPAAAITVEDAEMLQRMQDRGQKITVDLELNNEMKASESHNIIAEIKGQQHPEQIILMGGHFDSWDTGSQTGAMDDGAGTLVTLEALKVVADLGIRPLRTLRWIAWSGEEMGLPNNGAQHYVKKHGDEDHVVALENDVGQLTAIGFGFSGKLQTSRMVRQLIMNYIPDLSVVNENDGSGVDTKPLGDKGVPLMRNIYKDPNDDYYFKYHHSAGDTMNILNPDEMDSNVFAISSMMYIIADNPERLPK